MNLTVDSIIEEFLSLEKTTPEVKPTFLNRVRNIFNRKDIQKAIQDEKEASEAEVLKNGKLAESFLNSDYYHKLIEPLLRQDIKGGIHRLILEGDTMTEAQIKSELSIIKSSIAKFQALKRKVLNAESINKEKANQ